MQPTQSGGRGERSVAQPRLRMEISRVWRTPGKSIDALTDLRNYWRNSRAKYDPECLVEFILAFGRIFGDTDRPIPDQWMPMIGDVSNELEHRAAELGVDSLCALVAGMIAWRKYHSPIIRKVLDIAAERAFQFSRKQLQEMLRCSAFLPYPEGRTKLDALLAQHLMSSAPFIRRFGHDATYSAWLLAINNPAAAREFLSRVVYLEDLELGNWDLLQLHHAALACGFRLSRNIRQQIQKMLSGMAAFPPAPNNFESSVVGEARTLWPNAEVSQQEFCEGFFPDIRIQQDWELRIECDGVHFHQIELLGDQLHMWGLTRFRHDLLQRVGCRVAHLLDVEWFSMDRQARLQLLSARAKAALPGRL